MVAQRVELGLAINRSRVQILLGAMLRNNLGQVAHLCASVTKQYNLVPAKRPWCSAAGEVTAGLAETNGSLLPGGWLMVTCGLTGCTPGSALGPTLSIKYGKPLPFTFTSRTTRVSQYQKNIDSLKLCLCGYYTTSLIFCISYGAQHLPCTFVRSDNLFVWQHSQVFFGLPLGLTPSTS